MVIMPKKKIVVKTRDDMKQVVNIALNRAFYGDNLSTYTEFNDTMAHGRPVIVVTCEELDKDRCFSGSAATLSIIDDVARHVSRGKVGFSGWWTFDSNPFKFTFTFIVLDEELNEKLRERK